MSLFIVGLDTTIVNLVLPSIQRDLHATASGLQRTMDAYSFVDGGLDTGSVSVAVAPVVGVLLAAGFLSCAAARAWVRARR
ncbi:hypothetical protein [Streptomyces montanus]|uniref:hypothetical protein n=1 Tax=Streptomyces montanus TaxID=2580423 RepID=UPI001486B9CC